MALGYDLSVVKRIDSYENVEVRIRTAVLAAIAGFAAWVLNDPVLIGFYIAYLVIFTTYTVLLSRWPRRVAFGRFSLLVFLGFSTLMSLMGACLYLFTYAETYVRYGGLILYFCVVLNVVALRIREPSFYLADISSIYVTGLGFILIELVRSGLTPPTYMIALGMIGFCLYMSLIVFEMDKFRKKIEAGRLGQIASEHERAIGQIAGGVAHEFNNLLTVVLGNLELSREVKEETERTQLLSEAEAAARRGARLTGQLLAFSRKANLSPQIVHLDGIKVELEPLASGLLGRAHRLNFSDTKDLAPLFVDPATLLAVLLNLILNAREAMPDGGTVWLDATQTVQDGQDMMCLQINDTGTGIAPQIMEKVFEPFFSTKPPGQGSGLGLSMALGFAEQSGGSITVKSTPGEGTEVCLFLPIAASRDADAATTTSKLGRWWRGK